MIPLRDVIPSRTTPFITVTLIVLNGLAWFYELAIPEDLLPVFLQTYGVVPADFSALTLVTSMFLHGSWSHVIGNMWFLWIFGDNIEDYLGHFTYLAFYLISGLGAAFAQVILNPHSRVPTVGASGAIAGVLGAYFVLYPKARVLIWFPIAFFFYLPAWVTLGYWFLMQFVSGAATSMSAYNDSVGGVAFWAHVGGFVVGIILIKIFPERPRRYRYGTW
jgi:membrane associated rhomboid family serine protease